MIYEGEITFITYNGYIKLSQEIASKIPYFFKNLFSFTC